MTQSHYLHDTPAPLGLQQWDPEGQSWTEDGMSHSEKGKGGTPRESQNYLQSESEKWKLTSLVAGQMSTALECLKAKLTGIWVCCQEWRRTEGQGVVSSGLYPGAPLSTHQSDPKLWTGLTKVHSWSGPPIPHEQDYKAEKAP